MLEVAVVPVNWFNYYFFSRLLALLFLKLSSHFYQIYQWGLTYATIGNERVSPRFFSGPLKRISSDSFSYLWWCPCRSHSRCRENILLLTQLSIFSGMGQESDIDARELNNLKDLKLDPWIFSSPLLNRLTLIYQIYQNFKCNKETNSSNFLNT